MHVIFVDCHDLILVKERDPVEQSIEESLWIGIKPLTDTVNGDMVVDKLDQVFAFLKGFPHEIFLITIKRVKIATLIPFELLWEIFEESS